MKNIISKLFVRFTPAILQDTFQDTKIPFSTRLFIFIRWITAPMEDTEKELPKKGRILDLGSGHGLFTLYAALKNQEREHFGIEPDAAKVVEARKLTEELKNVKLKTGFFSTDIWKDTKFDAVIINDVMYLLPPEEKRKLLHEIKKVLAPGGTVIIKTNNAEKSFGYLLCYLQEVLSVGLMGVTFAKGRGLYFYTVEQYHELFEKCGYIVVKEKKLHTSFFHPHYLFVIK